MALSRKVSSSIQGVVTSAWSIAARGMGTHTGTVKFFQPKKGFGFLTTESEPGKDVFVHQSDIVSNGFRFLVEGEAVEFDVIESERGLVAQKVTAPGGGPVHENRQDNGSEQVRY